MDIHLDIHMVDVASASMTFIGTATRRDGGLLESRMVI